MPFTHRRIQSFPSGGTNLTAPLHMRTKTLDLGGAHATNSLVSSDAEQADRHRTCHLSVTTISTCDELQRVVPTWLEFLEGGTVGQNVDNDPRAVLFALEQQPLLVPRILLVWCGNKLMSVAPFYIQSGRYSLELSVWKLLSFPARVMRVFGESIVLADDADPSACVSAIGDVLTRLSSSIGFLQVYGLNYSNRFWQAALRENALSHHSGWVSIPMRKEKNHQILLNGTFDEYVATRSARSRQNLRHDRRQLFDGRTARIEKFTESSDVARLIQWMDQVYRNSWQGKVFGGVQGDSAAKQKLLEHISAEGWLRSYVLLRDDEPVAFELAYQYRGLYDSREVGFSQKYSSASPGAVLTFCILEELHADRTIKVYDFGFGDMPYKRKFGNVEHDAAIVYFVPANRWRYVLRLQTVLNQAYDGVRNTLVRLRADKFVRKLIKRQK
jgi:hypothetical protein